MWIKCVHKPFFTTDFSATFFYCESCVHYYQLFDNLIHKSMLMLHFDDTASSSITIWFYSSRTVQTCTFFRSFHKYLHIKWCNFTLLCDTDREPVPIPMEFLCCYSVLTSHYFMDKFDDLSTCGYIFISTS